MRTPGVGNYRFGPGSAFEMFTGFLAPFLVDLVGIQGLGF